MKKIDAIKKILNEANINEKSKLDLIRIIVTGNEKIADTIIAQWCSEQLEVPKPTGNPPRDGWEHITDE